MWIYFVLLASLTWSFTNVFDKFLIDKKVDKPLILTIFIRAGSVIPLLFIIPFVGFSLPSMEFIGWILLAGIFAAAGVIIFYKAIQIEEVSRTVPLFQFIPVFVLFLSFIFIGEVLGFFDYVGFIVLVIGGLVITAKSLSRLLKVEKVFWLIALSSLLHASSYVIMKYVLNNVEYWNAFILLWLLQALIIFSLLGSRRIRKDAKIYIKKIDVRDKTIILTDSVISLLGFIFNYFAISLGPVTLVEAAGNAHLVFIFILAVFMTRFFPNVLREKFDRKITTQKIAGIVLIITGILLMQLF